MNKIQKGSAVLLLGKSKNYLVEAKGEFHCQFGKINMESIIGKNYGTKVKSNLGEEFSAVRPNINDFLAKGTKRLPQVILPKDAAVILAATGVDKNSVVLDAGTGSGFLSIFLANYAKKVYTYEKRKEFFSVAKQNIKNSGLKNIVIKNKDILESKEKNVDLATLDMENAKKVIKHVQKALKSGGWLVVYYPHIEQILDIYKEISKYGFTDIKIFENFQRELIPKEKFLGERKHILRTGFMIFARKL